MNNNKDFSKVLWRWLRSIWVIPCLGILLNWKFNLQAGQLGSFGDFIAGTTVPLLTFVSFLAVNHTLKIQEKQIKLQQKQIKDQGEILGIQLFENTFFNMINLHNEIVGNMKDINTPEDSRGREVFETIYSTLKNIYNFKTKEVSKKGIKMEEIQIIRMSYNTFRKDRESELDHYFRSLYSIMKYIDREKFKDIDKEPYLDIIKAQLSSFEVGILFYHGLSIEGQNFLSLIHKYGIIENSYSVIFIPEHVAIYNSLTDKVNS
ncbi:putative phage abortive infection protein [Priestia megaterium]|uniref:putative phage abortive infection protein n=1 Tax=Priestia megaterium TaxID=1404 RepID=UPI00159CBC0C|nr:putative phage abortive infection protein [Priestia megaterium]